MNCTIFQDFTRTNSPNIISLQNALDRIKSGKSKKRIDEIRACEEAKERAKLKRMLPCVLFSGEFTQRSIKGLKSHNGFIILDFDHVKESKKEQLKEDENIYAVWRSPSGDGFKALMMTDCDGGSHSATWNAIKQRYPEIDPSCKDVSRITFESYDPDLWINEDCVAFTGRYDEPKAEGPIRDTKKTDYSKVQIALNMIRNAVDGEKHHTLLKAARLMGGYIAGGHVTEAEAERLLKFEVESRSDILDLKTAYRTISDGIAHGKGVPIEEHEKAEKEPSKLGKISYSIEDVWGDIEHKRIHGNPRGRDTRWSNLNEHYSVLEGCTTYLYGQPHCGKSQFWFCLLIGLSIEDEHTRHLLFSPEGGQPSDVFAELMEIYLSKNFFIATEQEMHDAKQFIGKHFIVTDPIDKDLTMKGLFDEILNVQRQYGVKLTTATIDPFNELKHDINKRGDVWLEEQLGDIRKFARGEGIHVCVITHVRDQQLQRVEVGGKTIFYYPPPTPREVSYGQAWFRKGQSMIALWRPKEGMEDEHGVPYHPNVTQVIIHKAKPKGIGKVGKIELYYNFKDKNYHQLPVFED